MINIELSVSDLSEIKQFANREYMANTMPKELEGPEFLVLCYALAVDKFLNKKGVAVNLSFAAKRPYEPTEE